MPFRVPVSVIRRGPGSFVRGVFVPSAEPAPTTIQASIQPAEAGDFQDAVADPAGRRYSARLCLRTASRLAVARPAPNAEPGDIVLHDGARWLIIGEQSWNVLGRPVSHYAYLIIPEGEGGQAEGMG